MRDIKTILNDWKNGEIEIGLYTSIDENGDNVIVEVATDYIRIATMQKNNWQRNTYYYQDGTVEETYERGEN